MEYSELITIILTITALLLFRQLIIISRKNAAGTVEDYSGRALVPEALTRVDDDSMREFDKLLSGRFSEEQ